MCSYVHHMSCLHTVYSTKQWDKGADSFMGTVLGDSAPMSIHVFGHIVYPKGSI